MFGKVKRLRAELSAQKLEHIRKTVEMRGDMAMLRMNHANAIGELQTQHTAELESLKSTHVAEIAYFKETVAKLEGQAHAQELKAPRRKKTCR
jgi:hypothetical protein